MGTSIASTLTRVHGLPRTSDVLLVVATGILVVLTLGWLRHRNPNLRQEYMGPWGMVSMGLLALGGAWTGVTGYWSFQIAVFVLATPLAVVACLWQLRRFSGAPTFLWGLGLVSPMVSATSGGQSHLAGVLPAGWSIVVWVISVACFLLSPATAAAQLLSLGRSWDRVGIAYVPDGHAVAGQSPARRGHGPGGLGHRQPRIPRPVGRALVGVGGTGGDLGGPGQDCMGQAVLTSEVSLPCPAR